MSAGHNANPESKPVDTMERARLVLDYIKSLIWPLVAILILVLFFPEVKTLLSQRLTSANIAGASFTFGTGQNKVDNPADKSKPPDVWFSLRETPYPMAQCIDHAKDALNAAGYKQIVAGETTYGYDEKFVGALWCGWRDNFVLITVAGPYEDLEAKRGQLERAFFGGRP